MDRQVQHPHVQKFTPEALRAVRLHLKELKEITPESMRALSCDDPLVPKAHGAQKPQQLQLSFCASWPELRKPRRLRAPHQPPKDQQLSPTPAMARKHLKQLPSNLQAVQSIAASSSEVPRADVRVQLTASADRIGGCWSVHTPLSEAAQQRLEATLKRISARNAHAASLSALSGGSTAGSDKTRKPGNPRLAPGLPKPRKKVWEAKPYSVHAPNFQRVRPKGKQVSSNELRRHIMGKGKP